MKINLKISFFLLFLLAVIFTKLAVAQSTPTETYYEKSTDSYQIEKYGGDQAEVHKTRFDSTTFDNLTNEIQTRLTGTTQEVVDQVGPQGYRSGAVTQMAGLLNNIIFRPPVSSGEYFADIKNRLGFPTAYAAAGDTTGWQALLPVLQIWKAFRNVAYIAFIIVFIATGFMIMFRQKMNQQAVVSIEAALPKIVLTLLLVTFSYAIAGLTIDLIYIILYLIVGVFSMGGLLQDNSITTFNKVVDLLLHSNPFDLVFVNGFNVLTKGPAMAIQNLVGALLGANWGHQEELFQEKVRLNIFGGIVNLVISIALLFTLFKLYFSLLMSYLSIIISVILAPVQILINAFPGSNAFVGWLKNLFANIIVFPAVAGLFLLAAILVGANCNPDPATGACSECGASSINPFCVNPNVGFYSSLYGKPGASTYWIPPLMGASYNKGGAGPNAENFQALIALGLIMMSPQLVTQIKKLFKVEGGGGLGGAVMGGIMAGPKMLAAVPQTGYDLITKGGYLRNTLQGNRAASYGPPQVEDPTQHAASTGGGQPQR